MKDNESHITWGCSDDLESRFHKTLYCGEEENCFYSTPSASLTDAAVSIYVDAAPSPKRRLSPRFASSIAKRMPLSPCTIVLGILYIERLRSKDSSYLNCVSSSDLFVASMLIASKYLVDEGESDEVFNDEWAAAGGLAVSSVNKLEIELLSALHWELYVSPPEFLAFCNSIETRIALLHGSQRGWFSYTDITHCLDTLHLHSAFISVVESTLKVIASCALAYTVSVALVAGTAGAVNSPPLPSHSTAASSGNHFSTGSPLHAFGSRSFSRSRQEVVGRSRDYACTQDHLGNQYVPEARLDSPLFTLLTPDTPSDFISRLLLSTLAPPGKKLPNQTELSRISAFPLSTNTTNSVPLSPLVLEDTFLLRFQTRFDPPKHVSWFTAAMSY